MYIRPTTFAIVLAVCISSCKPKEQPVTKDEALATARTIDSAISNHKPAVFNELINARLVAMRVAEHAGMSLNKDIIAGVRSGLEGANMGDQIIRSLAEQDGTIGSYQLVKQYEKDKKQHLIFRLYSSGGLNYHDLLLAKENGKVGIADMYIYLVGQDFSALLSDFATSLTMGKESDAAKQENLDRMKKVRQLMSSEQYEDAKRYYDGLPENLRKQKLFMVVGIQIASKLDNEVYLKQLEEFEKTFPNEPNIQLLLIDAHILRKDYDKAFRSVEKLDQIIDKDPFLDFYRGLTKKLDGKMEEARNYFISLVKNMPDFNEGYIELIASYLTEKQDEQATALIEQYKAKKEFNQTTLESVLTMFPDYSPPNATQ